MFQNRGYLPALIVMGVFSALTLAGCSSEEEIGHYEAPVDEGLVSAHSMGATSPPRSPNNAGPGLTYTKPEGWAAGEVSGMRKAAFYVENGSQKVEITVIDLAASAGMLMPNVNIWRQQIQLGPSTPEELLKVTTPMQVGGTKGHYVELMGPEDAEPRLAILAVMVVPSSKSWFFKLKGDAELALAEKERFQEFVKSVKFQDAAGGMAASPHGSGKLTSPHGSGMPMGMPGSGMSMSMHGGSSPLAYDAPDSWAPGQVRGLRKAAFQVEDGDQKIEITAIDLSASAGELLPNVNRWRQQVGAGTITEEELQETIRPIQVLGVQGHYVELFGPEDAERPLAILGALAVAGGKSWFVKMSGDAELVLREKERFQDFVKSLRFKAKETPADEAPAEEAPAEEAPAEEAPAEEAPAEEAPAEEAPAEEAPAEEAPAEEAPVEGAEQDE